MDVDHHKIDMNRAISKVAVKMTESQAICALILLDKDEDTILEVEWENCEYGR